MAAFTSLGDGERRPPTPVYLPGAAADSAFARRWEIPLSLAHEVRMAADTEGVPRSIAFPLVRVESGFDSTAVSWVGARGLSQLMPATAYAHCGLAKSELFIVRSNLRCGFSYLRMLRDRYGEWESALAAYNVGPGTFALDGRAGRSYALRVLAR